MRRFFLMVLGLGLLALNSSLMADVRLPAVYSDHMVLQQKAELWFRGWADNGEMVTVSIGSVSKSTTADQQGRWQVALPAMNASSTPVTVRVIGRNMIEFQDVLIGEVWLCSGQSNMEWPVAACSDAENEIRNATDSLIRHIKVPLVQSNVPLNDFQSSWQVCSPETAGGFTACGYFMARELRRELKVPIGLVNSSWGGTRIEPWTPPVGFQNVPALSGIYESVMGRTPGTDAYRARLSSHIRATEEWLDKAKIAVNTSDVLAPSPAYPGELTPFGSNQDPTMLYNGMIHSLVGYPIRGAIWYQGESNHAEGMLYLEKMKALIGGWRTLWGQGDFPFYFVQIAPFRYGTEDPEILARFWEAQAASQQIPHTGMVVINDIATINDIHPPNKQDVGRRLALQALKNDYGRTDVVAASPEFETLTAEQGRLRVTFRNTGGGLKTRDGNAPTHFQVVGAGSGGFQDAVAVIDGDSVILSSDKVASPVAFRFAWHMLAEPNLCGGTGLPVGACRGGDVPGFLSSIPVAKEYTLVYDLDLAKLGREFTWDEDHSKSIGKFDRVAYLVELKSGDAERAVFVSMEAFTDDVSRIGIPTAQSGARFQQPVKSMDVFSNVSGITTGTGIATGNLEFWPGNYGTMNTAGVSGAADGVYDFGDEPVAPESGYGSMQVHNFAAGQTLFSINNWGAGTHADLGIGNSEGNTRDWTFTGNAESWTSKRLRVFVRCR